MRLSDIKQGTVFQIPLIKNYGYTSALLIQFETNYDGQIITDNILYPLDYFSKESNTNPIDIGRPSYMFTPSLMLGTPKIRGNRCWKIIGYKDISSSDLVKPDFKLSYELNRIKPGEDLRELTWYHVKGLDSSNSKQTEFTLVKHLGFFAELNYSLIEAKLTFEWILENGEKISEYFSEQDFKDILGLEMIYAHVLSSTKS